MNQQKQKQFLMQQLSDLQMLIDVETNTAYRQSLEKEKADCLKKLVELNTQTQAPNSKSPHQPHSRHHKPKPLHNRPSRHNPPHKIKINQQPNDNP
ncbi:hypothetical protein NHP21005_19930 (plasmid) [Helicobacter sp. NHP21005]|uniref:hypothetical protein n=1 Tax=Helicobacter felistomachi TaxID=3040201 RepID=UPI0025738F4A|nr:hypothetical protein [Helicobacter sp. NHP21005]BEG58305.1 hypothetical protein NHP21005_19930 [Helicobacter sp. NHP21005]